MEELKELFDLAKSDDQLKTALISFINTMHKLYTSENEHEFNHLVYKYRSWEELDMASRDIDEAIEKNKAFQQFLDISERVAKRVLKIALRGVI